MTGAAARADHRLQLPGTTFAVWRTGLLRGAGFPAANVLALAAPDTAALADRLIEEGVPRPDRQTAHEPWRRLRRALDEDERRARASLRAVAADPWFQEAVIWQNREFFVTGVTPFLAYPADQHNQTVRRKERAIARYLQRYCTKNDSIGFFGPFGWCQLSSSGAALTLETGPALIAGRTTHFEHWAADAIAQALVDPAQKPWLAPRRLPLCRLAGDLLHYPALAALALAGQVPPQAATPVRLSPSECRVLQACDGATPAAALADMLVRADPTDFRERQDVFAALDRLEAVNAIRWRLEAPMSLHPEAALRAQLVGIDEANLRERAVERLDRIENARRMVSLAAGNARLLNERMTVLEEEFQGLTGRPASRLPGQSYAGRTLLYEDCRRDADVTLGPEILDQMAGPLDLLLKAGRWFTYELAAALRARLGGMYRRLAQARSSPAIELADLTACAYDLLNGVDRQPVADVTTEFQRRWAALLPVDRDRRAVSISMDGLTPKASAAFSAPCAGWSAARYMCPDVMIAAASAAAVASGDYRLVLGEFHLMHTVSQSCMLSQHAAPRELVAARSADLPQGWVIPMPAKDRNTQRTAFSLVGEHDLTFEYNAEPSIAPRDRALPLAELVAIETDGGLRVRTRDGRWDFDVIDFFGHTISTHLALNLPALLPPAAHLPRLTLGRVIVARESWRVDVRALTCARVPDAAERFVAVRRWAREAGLPRWVFVRPGPDAKPSFVDFDSPLLVDLFCKWVQDAAAAAETHVVVSEMLPTFDQLWLADAGGRRFTSELRLVVFDGAELGGAAMSAR